ncbi:hypothetical protein CCMSSC00406_0006069 [Pleurotus cornucopiae]|uniref:Uncharacterized protein n=1 Tax=Pleurotus cornucopiae TaxID=5321 RepID=A0ACB7J9F7_PLECO|nr:hypothetical protein CCMSSC00406_0006069 [Pleurotus cornucopiae]
MSDNDGRGSIDDIDIVALMRRLAVAYPEAAAAAAAPGAAVPAVAIPAATVAPASADAEGEGLIPVGGVFRCPSCHTVHNLVLATNAPASSPAAPNAPAAPPPALNAPTVLPLAPNTPAAPPMAPNTVAGPPLVRTGHFSAATGVYGHRWYAVVIGRQVGVFQHWHNNVEPLVTNVPGWLCRGFSSFANAENYLLERMHIARIHQ